MRLADLYTHLHARAAATGEDQACTLPGGARMVVRVRGGVTTLSLGRPNKPLGATEEATFKVACSVPPEALRIPAEGQLERLRDGVSWHIVGYRWGQGAEAEEALAVANEPKARPA